MSGSVIVENNTGSALHATGCTSLFQVALGNDKISPSVAWLACLQTFTIPVGESSYPVTIDAFYSWCSSASVPPCTDGHPPPLPPGEYQAMLFQTAMVPTPPPIAVRVT
jgi:hypothetical protein